MAEDDPPLAEAQRARRFDELHPLHRHHLTAHDAGHRQPFDRPDRHKEQNDILPEEHHQQDDEDREGQGIHNVDDAHQHRVELAPEESRHRPVDHADGQGDKGGREAHAQGDPPAVQQAHQQVAAEGIRAQPMHRARGRSAQFQLLFLVAVRQQPGSDQAEDGHHGEAGEAEDGQLVLAQAQPSIVAEGGALLEGLGGFRGSGGRRAHPSSLTFGFIHAWTTSTTRFRAIIRTA